MNTILTSYKLGNETIKLKILLTGTTRYVCLYTKWTRFYKCWSNL